MSGSDESIKRRDAMKCRRGDIAEDRDELLCTGHGSKTSGDFFLDSGKTNRLLSRVVRIGYLSNHEQSAKYPP